MPRPSKEWEKKYRNDAVTKRTVLSDNDDILSASQKLGRNVPEAQAIILQILRRSKQEVFRLLDMDDMELRGQRIVRAYHEWAGNNYDKLLKAIETRDASLIAFIKNIAEVP